MDTTHTKEELKRELNKAMDTLYRVRDEVKVRVHLAGSEAKEAWSKLEPKLEEAEKLAKDTSTQALETIVSLTRKLEKLIASIGKTS